ncbi:MAG: hypothetical protein KGQ45_09730 [Burkholderiales bacterium]|nr:hypothetical protein [Burkholderiales bacterium]
MQQAVEALRLTPIAASEQGMGLSGDSARRVNLVSRGKGRETLQQQRAQGFGALAGRGLDGRSRVLPAH